MCHIVENSNEDENRNEESRDDDILASLAPYEQQTDKLKKRSMRYFNNLTNDIIQTNDEGDNTVQASNAHMKRKHDIDVTRLLPNYNFKDFYSADAIRHNQTLSDNQGGAYFDQNFSPDATLSSSSSVMHRQHPASTCSPSSSKIKIMLDDGFPNTSFRAIMDPDAGRDSILMRQALKSARQIGKRRESIGEVKTVIRKGPDSTSVIPRLTKSSNFTMEKSHHTNFTSNSNASKQRKRHYSLQQPISQKDRNELALLLDEKENDAYSYHYIETNTEVHWDPHIDAFEILRAKITGITRSMQEFHVKELFQDEKKKKKKIAATTSSPLITTTNKISKSDRRLSLTNNIGVVSAHDDIYNQILHPEHRRTRSQSSVTSYHSNSGDDETNGELDGIRITSPNLTTLFFTTNNLIHSRLDELSETASIQSSYHDIEEITSKLAWKEKFLGLVTSCIHQSEQLESLSTDLLNTEHRVRELMLINDTIHEQFNEREKQYEERIRECQEVAHQQLIMIDSLEELNADINMKIECRRREAHRQKALLALDNKYNHNRENRRSLYLMDDHISRWNFQKSVAEILSLDDKYDMIQKMRWDVGMFVGGGVGTGHIIHSFEDRLNRIDIMIAGTGTTSTAMHAEHSNISENDCSMNNDYNMNHREFYSITPSISRHIKLYQHQYVLHLKKEDRRTRFALLPKHLWIPDGDSDRCQFQVENSHRRCNTHFSFFERKHHCRKCGYILCQKHSANRLPLFSLRKKTYIAHWSRVCDNCFQSLIMK